MGAYDLRAWLTSLVERLHQDSTRHDWDPLFTSARGLNRNAERPEQSKIIAK